MAVHCGESSRRHAVGTEEDVYLLAGERAQGVQPAEFLQSLHDGPSASQHRRTEGHDRVLHGSHNQARGNGTRAGSLPRIFLSCFSIFIINYTLHIILQLDYC